MEKVLAIIISGAISAASLAEVPNQFSPGEVATAAKFNENFTSLSNEIDVVKTAVNNIESSGDTSPDGAVVAQVNGVDMRVSSSQVGYYNITTPTGKTISVNAEGYPSFTALAYESADCTGQAYVRNFQFGEYTAKPTGHIFANPNLSTTVTIVFSNGEIGYSLNETLTKLNYRTMDYGPTSLGCHPSSGTTLASKVLPNNPEVTGINSVPLIITGVGSELKISPIEVGTPVTGSFNVYANGTKIGTTTRHPDSVSDYVGVVLDDYNQASITLYKDGSYSGNIVSSERLHYSSSDCSGTPYYELANDADKKWWDTSLSSKKTIFNQGDHYNLSSQAYRVSSQFLSYKASYFDTCSVSTTDGTNKAYLQATITDTPEAPTFTPPITIEGYSEPTPYDSLPVAF